jgi:hypothetical protein
MLESLQHADFEPLLGHVFRMEVGDGRAMDLTLTEARPLGEAGAAGGRRPFSLVFVCSAGVHVPQRIYRLTHASLGVLDLFLVPIGPQRGGMGYQAIFN